MPSSRSSEEYSQNSSPASRNDDGGNSGGAGMAAMMILIGLLFIVGPFFIPHIPTGSKMAISAVGLIVLIIGAIMMIITSMYVKASMNEAFVRTGAGGPRVIINGGAIVVPAVHRIARVSLETIKLVIDRTDDLSFITGDSLHVDVKAQFFIRVNNTPEAIQNAATSLGGRSGMDDAIMQLVGDKLVSGLRTIAGRNDLEFLHQHVDKYSDEVKKIVESDLIHNGLYLESVTITYLNQTPLENFKTESNIFDAQGAKKIAEVTTAAQVEITRKKALAAQEVKKLEVDRDKEVFQLEVTQQNARAETNRQAAEFAAQQTRQAELARVQAERTVAVAEVEKIQAVEVASAKQQQAVQEAQIDKEKAIEVANREKQIAIANAEQQRANAQAEQITAETKREQANQQMLTVQRESEAERNKTVAVIEKEATARQTQIEREMEANVAAYTTIKNAEAEQTAAEKQADAQLKLATAAKQAKVLQAEGERAVQMIPVDVAERQVAVDQKKVTVLQSELEAKAAHQEVSVELQTDLARIAAKRDAEIALADAIGKALASADFKIFGDPTTAAEMLLAFTKGQQFGSLIEGAVERTPSKVTDLAMVSITQVAQAISNFSGGLFGKHFSAEEIAGAIKSQLATGAAAAAGAGSTPAKG